MRRRTPNEPGTSRRTWSGQPIDARPERPGVRHRNPRGWPASIAAATLVLGIGVVLPATVAVAPAVAASAPADALPHADQAPAITSAAAVTFTAGATDSFTVTTSGTPTPAITESGSLPGGVSFHDNGNGTATISGTATTTTGGSYPLTITANNGVGSPAVQKLVLTVDAAPRITSSPTASIQAGVGTDVKVTATGTPTPNLAETGTLPPGLSFHDNGNGTASITGTPPADVQGNYGVTITASNGVGSAASQHLVLSFSGAPRFTSATTLKVALGSHVDFTVQAVGAPTPTITFHGGLPAGLYFRENANGTGTVFGSPSPSDHGSYDATFVASNGVGNAAIQHLMVTIAAVPKITSPPSATLRAGQYNMFEIHTSGSPAPALREYGQLPAGLFFHDNGNGTATIRGRAMPSDHGTYQVTVVASNGVGAQATQHLTLTFSQAPAVTSAGSLSAKGGTAMSFKVTASGTPTPKLSENGSLPPGLSFHPNGNGTATISGTPARGVQGTYRVTIIAANGVGSPARQSLAITVKLAEVPGALGYWYTTSSGELLFKGQARPIAPKKPQHPRHIVTMAATPGNQGYYLVASFGGVFNYGNARFYGSIAPLHLRTPTVAFAVTAGDHGYYEVTRAGNVFAYGNAHFYGSMAGHHTPPIVGFGIMPNDSGYWLVSERGNVYRFGHTAFYGSIAERHLHTAPVSAFAVTPDGHGYWLVTRSGQVLAFGDAGYYGQVAGHRVPPVVAFAPTANGHGYWLVTARGNVYQKGNARFYGSSAHARLAGAVTGFIPDF